MRNRHVENKLRSLGLMSNYQGYHCLLHSVHLIQGDATYLDMATKRLYPEVARTVGLNVGSVDSAMRTAISLCCARCGEQVAHMCYGNTHPTISQFLHGLVHDLS